MRWRKQLVTGLLALALSVGAPTAACAENAAPAEYTLSALESSAAVQIDEEEAPLAFGPDEQQCCALHLVIMAAALGVTAGYVHDRKKHQQAEFELRRELA